MAFSARRGRFAILAALLILTFYYLSGPADDLKPSPKTAKPSQFEDKPQVRWAKLKESHPVDTLIPLPTGKPAEIPTIQAKPPTTRNPAAETERLRRLEAVKESFVHSWTGYKRHAWLRDEVVPIAGGSRDTFGGWAATLVDALDTLWIMDLKEEFELAVDAVKDIDFTTTDTEIINVFETTIRYMGGFLAAYDISGAQYPVLLEKAVEVGELLMSVFDTPNRMPITRWNWRAYMDGTDQTAPESMIVSEIGSLTLEFTRLAQLTGNDKYYDAIQRVSDVFELFQNTTKLPGMWPVIVNAAVPDFGRDNNFHVGGMSDSLYEYLPKQYMMLGGLLDQPRAMYQNFLRVAKDHMFFRPMNPDNRELLVAGEMKANGGITVLLEPRGQHLTCFAGGMVAIAAVIFNRPEELEIGKQLTDGCIWAYDSQVTGIAPEIYTLMKCPVDDDCVWSDEKWYASVLSAPSQQHPKSGLSRPTPEQLAELSKSLRQRKNGLPKGFVSVGDKRYVLRPEAIESVFILYRITGDVRWQDAAWRMFQAIERVCRTSIASSAILDVTSNKPQRVDSMESFWLAETLKYFYLIFADVDVVSLDEYVLNTEAHPLRRPT
ncbi:MAG: hypothetical protein M1818_003722 [Claussenomyces sp. TS43310]|nr:MAG: hypothetical protein M1818_003722 [Claussenomyces sp. TS43310]